MKFIKLTVAVAAALAVVLPSGGCSDSEKTPKVNGPVNPNVKPVGRSAPGGPAAKGGGNTTAAPVTRD
jgi:hypothetical protein